MLEKQTFYIDAVVKKDILNVLQEHYIYKFPELSSVR
jgi:hypothetical protein